MKVLDKTVNRFYGPLRKNPVNPRYFTDNTGKAIYLTGSHTWSVMQDMWIEGDGRNNFNYDEFLECMERYGHNFLRFWQFALQSGGAPWTDKIVSFDPLPYARTGPGNALDGMPKFDLNKWNDGYFERLRERVLKAGERGIYVSVMLFEGWCSMWAKYAPDKASPWPFHPYNVNNNINGIDGDPDKDGSGKIYSLEIPDVLELEKAFVRKVIDSVNDLDNVLFEIINEAPFYDRTVPWEHHMVDFVQEYEKSKPKRHPVGLTAKGGFHNHHVYYDSNADWISPANDIGYIYMLNPPAADGRKVMITDTDHLWGIGGDYRWVWKSFMRGLNPIFMDPWEPGPGHDPNNPTNQSATGEFLFRRDRPQWEHLRMNMGYTRKYAERIDLNRMVPHGELSTSGYCLANPGLARHNLNEEYLVYLPGGGSVGLDITPDGKLFKVEWFNPVTGETFKGEPVEPSIPAFHQCLPNGICLTAPFDGDAVVYLY